MDLQQLFKQITGDDPYDFQLECAEALTTGNSLVVSAPTGLGKTKAALIPVVNSHNDLLKSRLIYTLPLRALTKGVAEELENLTSIRPTIHHGDEPESRFFSERAVITTVDQYFTAFAGSPLSWSNAMNHAATGALLTSYSVFDEIHLLSSKTGLQLLFAILRLRQRWGLLSCVMTATMPQSVKEFFKEFCGLKVIDASDNDIQKRDSWRKVGLQLLGEDKTSSQEIDKSKKKNAEGSAFKWELKDSQDIAELVKDKWNNWETLDVDGPKKVIVFVNTVDRAIKIYEALSNFGPQICLAHSRFIKEHRQQIEERIQELFGKNAQVTESILITTQVAEAGLNISAPLVITELCPIDSLIQRIGRCQRFKTANNEEMQGLVLVVKPKSENEAKWYMPYRDSIVVHKQNKHRHPLNIADISSYVLEQYFGNGKKFLDWSMEKTLVDEALSEAYSAFLSGSDRLDYDDVKDRPIGKLWQRLEKGSDEKIEAGEEYAE